MSWLSKAKGWLGKKKSEPTDRVTRAATSSSTARVSFNDDAVPPELLEETNLTRSMTYPCQDFLTVAGIKEEFDNLCANAGLARLITRRVPNIPNSPTILSMDLDIIMMLPLLSL